MKRRFKPPIETVATGVSAPLATVSLAILACAATAALLGGDAALDWAERLPVHPLSDILVEAAASWRDLMRAVGLGDLAAGLRRLFRAIQGFRM